MGILLGSSLYGEMSGREKELLLDYLITSYFRQPPGENNRARPRPDRSVPDT